MRILLCYCLFFILLALMSCRTEEEATPLSPMPAIIFKDLTKYTSWVRSRPVGGYAGDSINLTISYQDGDNDLGYNHKDRDSLINLYSTGAVDDKGLYIYNYYLELEKKVNGVFKPVVFPSPGLNLWGVFPRPVVPDPAYDNVYSANPFKARMHSPHHGEITYRFVLEPPQDPSPDVYIMVGDTVRCSVHVADRARNLSNTIETPEFVFMK
jgi:hypothetical protein